MKIAIIVWDLSIGGGTQRQVLELSRYLIKTGCAVKIYCAYLDRSQCHPELIENLEVVGLVEGSSNKKWNPLIALFCAPLLLWREEIVISRRLVEKMDNDFDLVNCHDHCSFSPSVYYKRRYGSPVVWMMNDIPNYFDPRFQYGGLKGLLFRLLYLARGELFRKSWELGLIKDIDRLVVLDRKTQQMAEKYLNQEATIIRSGLDTKAFFFHVSKTMSKGEIYILANGIFFPWRRYEDLIAAVKLLKDKKYKVRVNIIGEESTDIPYYRKIRKLIKTTGLWEEFSLLGSVSQKRLITEYQHADVFVFPNYPQSWGLAVFEAMACGTPVVVSTGCGASEILTDGKNALLVPFMNPVAIAEAVERLAKDNILWQRLSINGRNFVQKNITWDIYGKEMTALFDQVVTKADLQLEI